MFSARRLTLLPLVPVLVASWLATPAAATDGPCANANAIQVPGAELQQVECHDDLSATALAAQGRSDISDWAGLHSKATVNPPAGAGIQVAEPCAVPVPGEPWAGSRTPPARGGLVQQRPEDLSGDYSYDLAHEQTGDRGRAPEEWRGERSGPAPVHRKVELDQDLSYDEAHDF